jgi:hypothetical protein
VRGLEGEQAAAVLWALVLACSLPIVGVAAVGSVGAQEQFEGEIALNGNQATSSTSWSYDINDVEAAENLSVELTGREVLEQRSRSTITESSTLDLDPRGTAEPRNATMRLVGSAKEDTRGLGYETQSNSTSIEIGGNSSPEDESITISGQSESVSKSPSGTSSTTVNIADIASVDNSASLSWAPNSGTNSKGGIDSNTDASVGYSYETGALDVADGADEITVVFDQDISATDTASTDGSIDVDYYVSTGSNTLFDASNKVGSETMSYYSGFYSGFFEETISHGGQSNVYMGFEITGGTDHDIEQHVSGGEISVATSDGSISIDGTARNDGDQIDISPGSSHSIDLSGAGGSWQLDYSGNEKTLDPSISVGDQTLSHNGYLDDGETISKNITLSAGTSETISVSSSEQPLSGQVNWTERILPTDPTLKLDGGETTIAYDGKLSEGQIASKSIDLTTGTHSASISSDGPVKAAVEWEDVSTTDDPTVSINGETTSYSGTLAAGQTTSLDVSDNWIKEGTNTVEIDMADPGGGPSPQVGVDYSHDAATSASASIQSSTWQEDVEITRSFASDQQNVEATIPLPDNVVDVGSVEMARDGGGWTSVPESDYSHDGDLQVSVGDVAVNESVSVRTTASKVRMQSGEVRVLDPTTEGNDLSTTVEIVDDAGSDPVVVDVSETVSSDRSHVVTSSEWPASDSVRYQSDGTQELRLPDAVGGSNATIATAPFDVEPRTGDAVLRVDNQTEPRVTIEPGSTTGDELSLTWFGGESSEYYELYDVDNNRQIDTGQANSPVTFDLSDGSTTYTIQGWEPPSSVVGIAGGDGGSGAGPPLLLLVSLLGVVGSVVIGRRLGIGWLPVPAVVVIVLIGGELTTSRSLLATISGDLLRGSSGPLLAIVAAVLGVGLLWIVDSRTRRDIPTAAFAIPAVAGLGWLVSEVVSGVPEPLIALGGGVGVVIGVLAIDRGTSISVPRSVLAGAGLLSAGWTIETIAPGTLTRPLEAGIAEVAPLLALAAVAVVILWIRR